MPRRPTASETPATGRSGAATRRWTSVVCAALLFVAILALPTTAPLAAGGRAPGEYQVKAAFLLNVARFVEWPSYGLPKGAPLVFTVLGDDPFGRDLDDTLHGQTIAGHRLLVTRVRDLADAAPPHVLFIASSEDHRLDPILDKLANVPVLTVSESRDFAARGGIIGLRIERNHVRFDVNLAAAERSGLRLSSRLLQLARVVRRDRLEAQP